MVWGFTADPQVAGSGALSLAGGNAAVQFGDLFVGEGPFPSVISAAMPGESDPFRAWGERSLPLSFLDRIRARSNSAITHMIESIALAMGESSPVNAD